MGSIAAEGQGVDTAQYAQFRANASIASYSEPLPENVIFHPGHSGEVGQPASPITSVPLLRAVHWLHDRFDSPEDGVFNAMQQLKDLGADRKLRTLLFSRSGEFRYKDTSGKDVLAMTPEDAFEYMVDVYRPIYEAIQIYLDESTNGERPYNDHGEQHIRNVHTTSIRLLREAGHTGKPNRFRRRRFQYPLDMSPDEIERIAAVADAAHDGGYFTNPERHPEQSIMLLEHIAPQLSRHPQDAEHIYRAIYLHEGDTLRATMKADGVRTHAEAIAYLAREYPFVPSLVLADKLDQNRSRVRKGKLLRKKADYIDPKLFLEDPHVETNLLLEIGYAGWERRFDREAGEPIVTFRVEFNFDQDIAPSELADLKYFAIPRSNGSGFKIDVSKRTRHERMVEERRRYLDLLIDRNNEIGGSRQARMMICSFALNPEQQRGEIVYHDTQTGRMVGYVFHRDSIDQDIENFWATLPEEARNKKVPTDLKI